MSDALTCPNCGGTLPIDAPKGLCPRCLLGQALNAASATADVALDVSGSYPNSVFETLSAVVGPLPRIRLPDTSLDATDAPSVSSLMPPLSDRSGRYELFGEIGRGGMGTILRGRDRDLGRELAIKVLLESHKDQPAMVRRFVEEAQIGGQLQHPGIVPVYDFGAFGDARPYFSMKLVEGHTLAFLLADRKDPGNDRPRFLSIFESIAQTVAYAHARGVVHRDLKPSNVMVGSFGEVQVMDWGLAKVLGAINLDDAEDEAQTDFPTVKVVTTLRSGSDADASRTGSVLGTPSYMAPEQAAGDVSLVDERADVFGLGAILCEILSGTPPYTGQTLAEVMHQASRCDTAAALVRLDTCGADAGLIALAKDCLARERADRPSDAEEVARRITAYLAGVQERLRSAERERAVAEARVVEEAKRRKVTLALAASVMALVVAGGAGAAWYNRLRERQAAQVVALTREAKLLRDQAGDQADDPARWRAAYEAVQRVEVVLRDAPDAATSKALQELRAEVQAALEGAESDRTLLERLVDVRSASADDFDGSVTDAGYTAAFGAAGIDLDRQSTIEVGARIRRRPASVARALVAALDHWNEAREKRGSTDPGWLKLVAATRSADPDPDRDDLRAAVLLQDIAERLGRLRRLSERARTESWAPASLLLLGNALARSGDVPAGVAVLRRAAGAYPGDAPVSYDLGRLLERLRPPQSEDAIRAYTAARAVRPETAHELAHALEHSGRGEEAEAVFRDLILRRPHNARHLTCYGTYLKGRGRHAEAKVVLARAVACSRAAFRHKPGDAAAHGNLGLALQAQGNLDAAAVEFRTAIELAPDDAGTHYNLGTNLRAQGKPDAAVAEFRKAIELKPDHAKAHNNLGNALRTQGKPDAAVAEYTKAIELNPDLAEAHFNLGNSLSSQGNENAAAAEFREAIRLKPDDAENHFGLGHSLSIQRKVDAAVAAYREAIRLKSDSAETCCNLGLLLLRQPEGTAEALALLRRGHELGSRQANWRYPSADWVRRAERLTALDAKLPAILNDEAPPADAAEALELARKCSARSQYAAAARRFAQAFALDPKLAENLEAGHRYKAACNAVLAGCGQGEDIPRFGEPVRAELRRMAHDWLKADLALWASRQDADAGASGTAVRNVLASWTSDPNLTAIRSPESLAKQPAAEREEWMTFWSEVDTLLARARGDRP